MQREESTRQAIYNLLTQQQLGVLSTAGEKGPYASLVAFAVSTDLRHLYFVTPRTTRKFANLTANAAVALLVNNSLNDPEDFHKAAAVTAVGVAEAVKPPDLKPIREQYLARHPYLEEFAHSPSCELVDIQVARYILVERFQNVSEYRIPDRP
jgi:general stress protein 26